MGFILKNIKHNVRKMAISDNLFYQQENKLFKDFSEIIGELPSRHIFINKNNELMIYSHPNLYNCLGEKSLEIKQPNSLGIFVNESLYVLSEISKSSDYKRSFIVFLDEKKQRQTEFKQFILLKDIKLEHSFVCFDSSEARIDVFNYRDKSSDWHYTAKSYFESEQETIIYQGRILASENKLVFFIHLEDWSQYKTIVLDSETGKELFSTEGIGGRLYEQNGKVYSIRKKGIVELNMATFEINNLDFSEIIGDVVFQEKTCSIYDNKLCISAKPNQGHIRSLVFLINTDTKELEWQTEILKDPAQKIDNHNRRQIEEIQMNENMIAILVAGNDLYTFFKEENNDI